MAWFRRKKASRVLRPEEEAVLRRIRRFEEWRDGLSDILRQQGVGPLERLDPLGAAKRRIDWLTRRIDVLVKPPPGSGFARSPWNKGSRDAWIHRWKRERQDVIDYLRENPREGS
jgi:hypothetical protein